MTEARLDTGKTIQELIARRDDANRSLDEALMTLRRDIDHLRQQNEELMKRLMAIETNGANAPVHLVLPANAAPALHGANDR